MRAVLGVWFSPSFVCLSVFRTISQKPMQLGSPDLTYKRSTMSPGPGNPLIVGSKGQRSSSRVTNKCRRGILHSCDCWLFLLLFCCCVYYWISADSALWCCKRSRLSTSILLIKTCEAGLVLSVTRILRAIPCVCMCVCMYVCM